MSVLPPSAGVIGWPVAHSKSPVIHRFWLERLGIDGDYGRFPVHPDNVGAAIRALPALGLAGVNVTVPHKVAVMAHLDVVEDSARRAGACNTVIVGEDGRLSGANTDIAGFAEPLLGRSLAGKPAVVIGAGGAARAVLLALSDLGCAPVELRNRSAEKAHALAAELGIAVDVAPLGAPLPSATLLVNATILGMAGQPPLTLDLAPLPADALVYDIVYARLETSLLAAARARGLETIDGLAMLIGQAAVAFERFYGAVPPRDAASDAALRAFLAA